MRRREFIIATGVAGILAGCSGGDNSTPAEEGEQPEPDGGDTPTETESPTATQTATPEPEPNTGSIDAINLAYRKDNFLLKGRSGRTVYGVTGSDGQYTYGAYGVLAGAKQWTQPVSMLRDNIPGANRLSGFIAGGGLIIVTSSEGDEDKYLSALDAETGEYLWTYEYGERMRGTEETRAVVPVEGGVLVNLYDFYNDYGKLYWLDGETGEEGQQITEGDRVDFRGVPAASVGDAVLTANNKYRYGEAEPVWSTGEDLYVLNRLSIVYNDDSLFGYTNDGSGSDPSPKAVSREDGSLVWEVDQSDKRFMPPMAASNDLVVYAGGDEGETVIGVEADTGEVRWERTDFDLPYQEGPGGGAPTKATLHANDRGVLIAAAGTLRALDPDTGETRVSAEFDGNVAAGMATQSRFFTREDGNSGQVFRAYEF